MTPIEAGLTLVALGNITVMMSLVIKRLLDENSYANVNAAVGIILILCGAARIIAALLGTPT